MDTTSLRTGYRSLLDAAASVANSVDPVPDPPAGEWNADQILAHVTIINAVTIETVCSVSAGGSAVYDNRIAQDSWTIGRVIERVGDDGGLRSRIAVQGDALCALVETLSDAELDTAVPTLLLSADAVLVDAPMPLSDLINGLGGSELPGHAAQLLALLPDAPPATS